MTAVQVTLSTDGPAVIITQQPAAIIPASTFSFAFVSNPVDSTVTYECQLTGSTLSGQDFVACTSPQCALNPQNVDP